jgi:hypothetical protein
MSKTSIIGQMSSVSDVRKVLYICACLLNIILSARRIKRNFSWSSATHTCRLPRVCTEDAQNTAGHATQQGTSQGRVSNATVQTEATQRHHPELQVLCRVALATLQTWGPMARSERGANSAKAFPHSNANKVTCLIDAHKNCTHFLGHSF